MSKSTKIDANDAIDTHAKSYPKRKKSDVPVFEVRGKVAQAIIAYKKYYKDKKNVEDKIKKLSNDITVKAACLHSDEVKKTGTNVTTVKLSTKDGEEVQVDVAKRQYSKIDSGHEEELREIFGDDYDEYFTKKREIKLTSHALDDMEIIKKLIKAVGKDKFPKYFEVKDCIVPTARFHDDRFVENDRRISEVIAEEVVRPYKIALR